MDYSTTRGSQPTRPSNMIREKRPRRFEARSLLHASATPGDPAPRQLTRTRHGSAGRRMYSSKVQQPTNAHDSSLATDSLPDLAQIAIHPHLT
jgi:hypothetical protein